MKKPTAHFNQFLALDIRIGTVLNLKPLPNARKPAYVLEIDFGDDIGIKQSSAQITDLYNADELIGRQVIAVVNFEEKQIGTVMSQCLVLGLQTADGVVLLQSERPVKNGTNVS